MNRTKTMVAAVLLGLGCTGTALAHEQGDWLMRFGASYVDPKSDNSEIVEVDGATSLTVTLTYMVTANLGIELLAAYPFEHDIDLVGGGEVANAKHLPPTLSVQYHFLPDGGFQPYVGLGLNHTQFFSEDTTGVLAGTDLDLDRSWGVALQVGADIPFNEKWFMNLNVRWMDIDTDASLDGAELGKVEIDPFIYGAHLGFRF